MARPKIYQRKSDGYYTFYYKKKHYTKSKKKDAEKLLTKLIKDEKYQKLIDDYGKTTVEKLTTDWLELQRGTTKKQTTFDRKEQVVKYQVIKYIGKIQVATLDSAKIQKWLNDLADDEYSYSTIKKAKEYLVSALRFYKVLNKFPDNPFDDVKIPESSKNDSEIVYYTKDELNKIYAEATRKHKVKGKEEYVYRLGDAVIILGSTGMRAGEFLALTWDDIDFKKGIISINKTRQRVKNRNKKTPTEPSYVDVITAPKTKKSIRDIPMSKQCKLALKRLQALNGKFEYVSATKEGTPITIRNFSRMFENIVVGAGMRFALDEKGKPVNKVYGPHSMRHSFATYLINEKQANIAVVSAIMGHADDAVTINKYVHTKEKDKKAVIKLID